MTALALTVLTASLLGSLHCAGMCGGFVAFYAGDPGRRGERARAAGHLAYSAGRLVAYASLGALAGALGAALDATGSLVGVQRAAAVLAGALIVLWGVAALLATRGFRVPRLAAPPLLHGLVSRGIARVAARPPATRALAIGLLTGCLPCGWLYAFVVTAAGTGSAPAGAALMAVFWLGTLPVMVSLGLGLSALAGPLRRHVPAACALAMIVVGLLAVAGRVRPIDPPAPSQAVASPAPAHHGHR
jgi:sulfite exporter TauE/SafE